MRLLDGITNMLFGKDKTAGQAFAMSEQAMADAAMFGEQAEQAIHDMPMYQTPSQFLGAFDTQQQAFDLGTSRLESITNLLERDYRQGLSGFAEQKLSEGLQTTQQNITRLAKTGGTRDIYAATGNLSDQASAMGAMSEQAMEGKKQAFMNFLPQAMQIEQGLYSNLAQGQQTLGTLQEKEYQSELMKNQMLIDLFGGAAAASSAFGQQSYLSGLDAQSAAHASKVGFWGDITSSVIPTLDL